MARLTVIACVRITRHWHAGSTVPSNERDRRRARDYPVIDRRCGRRPWQRVTADKIRFGDFTRSRALSCYSCTMCSSCRRYRQGRAARATLPFCQWKWRAHRCGKSKRECVEMLTPTWTHPCRISCPPDRCPSRWKYPRTARPPCCWHTTAPRSDVEETKYRTKYVRIAPISPELSRLWNWKILRD